MRISLRLRRLLLEQPNDARRLRQCLHRSLPSFRRRGHPSRSVIVARTAAISNGPFDPFARPYETYQDRKAREQLYRSASHISALLNS
jgi:hypothetical protein